MKTDLPLPEKPLLPPTFRRRPRRSWRVALAAVALGGAAWLTPALRAQYVYTKIVDNNDPVPGGSGTLFSVANEAAFDGATVVFRNGGGSPNSVWTYTLGGVLTRVADLNTAVPGGVGNFSDLSAAFPVVSGGTVVFAGRDSNTSAPGNFNVGIYSVPIAGGTISRVVDYHSNVPGGTSTFTGGFAHFSLDAGRVAFDGSGTSDGGVFAANTNGASLIAIADGNHPAHPEMTFPVVNFGSPVISAGEVLFFGNTVFDPSNGYNALYTNPATSSYDYDEIATSNEALPGDATGSFHTRFDEWRLDQGTVAFLADDANTNNPNFFGIYTMPADGGAFTKIVLDTDQLSGIGPTSEFNQFALGDGRVVFRVSDTSGNYGLYSAGTNGTGLTKILSTGGLGPFTDLGQPIGTTNGNTLNLGDNAAAAGSVVFRAFGGLYLATPASLAANLRTTLTHAPAVPVAGSTLTYTLTVTNAGPASAAGVVPTLALPTGLTFRSASGGGTFDAASSTVRFGNRGTFTPNQSATFTVVAGVDFAGTLTAGAYATSPTPDVNRNDNHVEDVVVPTAPAANSPYVFVKIVDTNTAVPNQPGQTFALPNGSTAPPAIDTGKVVFSASDANNNRLLWSANADGSGGLKLLAGPATTIPGGAGDKFSAIYYSRLGGGTVAFLGLGANQHAGIFSVPVSGGAVTALVTQDTLRPEGTGVAFGYQNIANCSFGGLGGGYMGFETGEGVYASPLVGGTTHVLVYPGADIGGVGNPNGSFGAPAFSGTRAVFFGGLALLGTFLDERRYLAYVDAKTVVPGSGGSVTFDSFSNPQVEGDTLVFEGHSGGNPGVYGLYSISARARGGAAVKLVDTNTPAPGGTGNISTFDVPNFGVNAGEVVFLGADGSNRAGFYSVPAAGGTVRKIVAVGDSLGGTLTVAGINNAPAQPNSLGQHRLAFRADFSDSATNSGGAGIFVAVPSSLVTPVITSATTASGTTGKAFSYQITASGSPTSYGAQGLPGGLAINASTGVISGKPNVAGKYTLTLNAFNAKGKGSATLTLTVALGPPVVTSATTASGTVAKAFSYQITASGSPTSYGVQGLPGGLSVNATSGLISGTPKTAGRYTLTLNAYNAAGKGSGTLTLTVAAGAP